MLQECAWLPALRLRSNLILAFKDRQKAWLKNRFGMQKTMPQCRDVPVLPFMLIINRLRCFLWSAGAHLFSAQTSPISLPSWSTPCTVLLQLLEGGVSSGWALWPCIRACQEWLCCTSFKPTSSVSFVAPITAPGGKKKSFLHRLKHLFFLPINLVWVLSYEHTVHNIHCLPRHRLAG